MKPLYLEMANIGPFVKKTRIDLRNIEEGGLFLISGPTGSGKSFIFDTICYALYGKTPSGREGHLASHHAGIGDEPTINFSFMVGSKEYLIRRTLDHIAFSKRGGGTTERKESASIYRVLKDPKTTGDSKLDPLATKKSDVHQRSVEILGLDMEQFARVIMIPQGEFRELLKAETKDREKLLRKLFDSQLYFNISDSLSRMYGTLNDELKESRSKNEGRIEGIVNKVGLNSGPGEGLTFREWSMITINELNTNLEGLKSIEKDSNKIWNDQLELLKLSEDAYTTDLSLKKAREKLVDLSKKEENEIKALLRKSRLSSRAGHLRPDLGRFDELMNERKRSLKELDEVKETVTEKRSKFKEISSVYNERIPVKEKELETVKANLTSLKNASPGIREIADIRSGMDPLIEEVENLGSERMKFGERLNAIEKKHVYIDNEINSIAVREDVVVLTVIRKAGEDLLDILERRSKIIKLKVELTGRKARIAEDVKESEEILTNLRKRREGSIASELASGLISGAECPVCGSIAHPKPREASKEDVTVETVARAESSLKGITDSLSEIENTLSGLKANESDLAQRSMEIIDSYRELGDLDSDELAAKIAGLKAEEEMVKSSSEKKKRLEREKQDLDLEQKDLMKKISEMDEGLNKKRMDLEGYKSRFQDRSSILEKFGLDPKDPVGSLDARLEELNVKGETIGSQMEMMRNELETTKEDLVKIEKELEICERVSNKSTQKYESARSEISSKIKEIDGVDDLIQLRNAILDEDEEIKIWDIIEEFKDELSGVKGRIEEYSKKIKESNMEIPDEDSLAEIQKKEIALKEEWKTVHGKMVNLRNDIEWVMGQIEEIERIKGEMGEKEEEIAIVGRLAMQVKGNSNPRISLERFFLAQRFEEVLIASNQRLKILSGGRFLLRRSGIRDKKSKGGLDIDVYDNHTGRERPASTLSGGQMFLSSLALALGLADVVQSRSGGIRMDALFIDEGFGSLDEETLQTALKVLAELRKGRLVGVISHVGELKRQIKTGFEVLPSPDGSTVKMIG